ncbi:MAG: tRNA (adenosine(37)-N6)-threonylcarbamoyltransferase complex ATPase subunit type 1 TsaE [Lachnospiraceae bacterium]|nr:tRNA (adenosine(37)-N6)-threonylcarbamoyltransferase complex ATPase subunit type 1 TsaE [Lachnospiraceae bacterium]
MIIETNSREETYETGRKLAEQAEAGSVYALSGDLGVGKTVFTQGFARGLGITEPVTSPTFTILQSYEEGRLPLHHFDVYRIADPEEMDEIGYEECFFGDGVSLVEWAELIEELLPEETIRITIEKDPEQGFDYRRITITGAEPEL